MLSASSSEHFCVFKVANEASGIISSVTTVSDVTSLDSVSDPRAFPLVSRRFYDTLGPVSAGLLQLRSGLAGMT